MMKSKSSHRPENHFYSLNLDFDVGKTVSWLKVPRSELEAWENEPDYIT